MLLENFNSTETFVTSRWKTCYHYGWDHVLKAAAAVYDYYDALEILSNNKPLNIRSKDDLQKLPESRNLCIRGNSTLCKMPIMIVFYNQLNVVEVSVPRFVKEFENCSYESVNRSLCTYLTSIELAMFR